MNLLRPSRAVLRTSLLVAAVTGAALVLNGCSSPAPQLQPKADYKEFTDITWKPETTARAPMRSVEVEVDPVAALTEGIYAFYDNNRSFLQIQPAGAGLWDVSEMIEAAGERTFSWGAGAATLYRAGAAVPNSGRMTVEQLADGRVLLRNAGEAPFNLAIALRAFDISGKPIRQLLRNNNNQPDELAWFMKEDARFPSGSRAYLTTYWLGDDEIVQPSSSAFTGAASLERLVAQFSKKNPFCLSYVNHIAAQPYGVVFDAPQASRTRNARRQRLQKLPETGTYSLVGVNRSIFCEPNATAPQASGTWRIRTIQGTRVLELLPDAGVASSDMGVQPVNSSAITVGFAEVIKPAAAQTAGRRTAKARSTTAVVPVRIVANNQPVVDFRLKFNPTAADAVSKAMLEAEASRTAYTAGEKARIKAQLEAGRRNDAASPTAAASAAPATSGTQVQGDPLGALLLRQ